MSQPETTKSLSTRDTRASLADQPAAEQLSAPGHFAIEVLSGLKATANRPGHPFEPEDIEAALQEAGALGIVIDATPWADVHRAWTLSQGSLRYADALYVAAAERIGTGLLTADDRISRSGAPLRCTVFTVS